MSCDYEVQVSKIQSRVEERDSEAKKGKLGFFAGKLKLEIRERQLRYEKRGYWDSNWNGRNREIKIESANRNLAKCYRYMCFVYVSIYASVCIDIERERFREIQSIEGHLTL